MGGLVGFLSLLQAALSAVTPQARGNGHAPR